MKKKIFIAVSIILSFICFSPKMQAKGKEENKSKGSKRILIMGLHNNVKSNHYYDDWIAEETGLNADSIDYSYNGIIADNITESVKKGDFTFIYLDNDDLYSDIINHIKVEGEEEKCKSDLTAISAGKLQQILDYAQADYLLVLNRHYLKWQEKPMRTLFHMVSYSVFDRNKNSLLNGNGYFTSMSLEKPDKMQKISKKTSSKIASNVIKSLALR
jgi:hypothetical protein